VVDGNDLYAPIRRTPAKLTTTNATPTVFAYSTARDNSVMQIEANITGYCTAGTQIGKGCSFKLLATIRKTTGVDPAIIGSVTVLHSQDEIGGATATIAVAAGSAYSQVKVTGVASQTINWTGQLRIIRAN